MSKVKKISFIGVWLAEVIFLPLGQMPWLVGITYLGWPETNITDIAQNEEGYLIKISFINMFFSNLPDYISILLYVKMYKLAKTSIQPEIEVPDLEAFGGIWVGDNIELEDEHVGVAHDNALGTSHQQDKMKSILNFLRFNAIFCLSDCIAPLLWDFLICQGIHAVIFCCTFQNVVCYFIPILVLGTNFKKFKSFWFCVHNSNSMQ